MSGVLDMNRLSLGLFDEKGAQRLLWSKRAGFSIEGGPIQTAVQVLKLDALESRRSMAVSYQGPLPDDQWQRDVKHWFEISLSAWQKGFVDSAVGVSKPGVESWAQAPNNTEEHKLCNSQVRAFSVCLSAVLTSLQQRRNDPPQAASHYSSSWVPELFVE